MQEGPRPKITVNGKDYAPPEPGKTLNIQGEKPKKGRGVEIVVKNIGEGTNINISGGRRETITEDTQNLSLPEGVDLIQLSSNAKEVCTPNYLKIVFGYLSNVKLSEHRIVMLSNFQRNLPDFPIDTLKEIYELNRESLGLRPWAEMP